jgi:hypothetical protein
MRRKALPNNLATNLLVRNRNCCCICQKDGLYHEVIIHHIDGNNRNNQIRNLAVLCLFHASQADSGLLKGKVGSGKKLAPVIVKELKKKWEMKIEAESKIIKPVISLRRQKQLEVLYHFEIHKIKNEIVALEQNLKEVKQKFRFLHTFSIEFINSGIKLKPVLSDIYRQIAAMFLFSGVGQMRECANAIYELSQHLVGTPEEKLKKSDLKILNDSIETIEMLATCAAEFSKTSKALEGLIPFYFGFGEIAHWYRISKVKRKIFHSLNEDGILLSRR